MTDEIEKRRHETVCGRSASFTAIFILFLGLCFSAPVIAQECAIEDDNAVVDAPAGANVGGTDAVRQVVPWGGQIAPSPVHRQPCPGQTVAQQQPSRQQQAAPPQQPRQDRGQVARTEQRQQITGSQRVEVVREVIMVPQRHYVNPICLAPGQIAPGAPIPGLQQQVVRYHTVGGGTAPRHEHATKTKENPSRVMSYSYTPGVIVYNSSVKPYPTIVEHRRIK